MRANSACSTVEDIVAQRSTLRARCVMSVSRAGRETQTWNSLSSFGTCLTNVQTTFVCLVSDIRDINSALQWQSGCTELHRPGAYSACARQDVSGKVKAARPARISVSVVNLRRWRAGTLSAVPGFWILQFKLYQYSTKEESQEPGIDHQRLGIWGSNRKAIRILLSVAYLTNSYILS